MGSAMRLVLSALLFSSTSFRGPVVAAEETTTKNLEDELTDIGGMLMKKLMPIASELATSPELSPECAGSLFKVFKASRTGEPWVIRMILANGLLPNNLLEGSLISLGGYEQCLKTRVHGSDGEVQAKGQYCSLFVYPPWSFTEKLVHKFQAVGEFKGRLNPLTITTSEKFLRLALRIGLCVLNACSEQEVDFLAKGVFRQYGANTTVTGCRTDDPKQLSPLQNASIIYFGVLGLLVAVGTLIEWIVITLPAPDMEASLMCIWGPFKPLMVFSAISNTQRLLKTTARPENENLLFLSGFKTFLISWVIYGHCYVLIQAEFVRSPFLFADLSSKVMFQLMLNSPLAVSTFFYLSGFTMSFLMLKSRKILRKQNPILVYITGAVRRHIRLMGPIISVIMATFLLPYFADGPANHELLQQQVDGCIHRWWAVLLSFNNFYPVDKMCLLHLWYVSTDVQIFLVIAFPLAILFLRHRKLALLASGVIILAFCIMVSLQTHFWNLLYSVTTTSKNFARLVDTLELIYLRPFTHVCSYIFGVVMGYVTVEYGKAKIGWIMQLAQWIISLALTGFVLFITLPWNRGNTPDDITTAVYAGFHRFAWALGLAWPSFACATGRGGLLNSFFSWKAFMPISRLVYCIYLVHAPLLYLRMGIIKTHISINEFFQLTTAIGVFGMSLFLGYLLYLSTEGPVGRIENAIFQTTVNSARKASKAHVETKKVPPVTGNGEVKKAPSQPETKLTIENGANKMEDAGVDNAAYESEKSKL